MFDNVKRTVAFESQHAWNKCCIFRHENSIWFGIVARRTHMAFYVQTHSIFTSMVKTLNTVESKAFFFFLLYSSSADGKWLREMVSTNIHIVSKLDQCVAHILWMMTLYIKHRNGVTVTHLTGGCRHTRNRFCLELAGHSVKVNIDVSSSRRRIICNNYNYIDI